jgi:ankyrin repeat protein
MDDRNENDEDEYALHDAIRDGRDLDEIRSIVEGDPPSLRRRTRHGLPLHEAIASNSPPSITRYLLEEHPEAVQELDGSEDLPAHKVCLKEFLEGSSDMETARLVVEAWPEALQKRNGRGYPPLHLAKDFELIRFLVDTCPESIQSTCDDGASVLHSAVECGVELAAVGFLVERCPGLVRTKDKHGRIPLHRVQGQGRLDVVKYLVEQDGESLYAVDNDGGLPLHNACVGMGSPVEIVAYLVDQAPQLVRVRRTKDGSLPIHLAVHSMFYTPNEENFFTIRILVQAWPESLRETESGGLLPVHYAAKRASLPLVRLLVDEWQESIQEKTEHGWLALHLVLSRDRRQLTNANAGPVRNVYETARFLMDQFPQSVLERTNKGYLPLHVAAMKGYGFRNRENVRLELDFFHDLVRRAPEALRMKSYASHRVPFQYAINRGRLSMAAARFLAEQWPDAVQQVDNHGRSAMHVAVSRDRLNYVEFLAAQRPQLLEATDRNGSTPLHLAVAQVRRHPLGLDLGAAREYVLGKLRGLLKIVRFLAERRPQGLEEGDNDGSLPLHVAVAHSAPDMVRLLVELRPEALGTADNDGSLPLHVAVASTNLFLWIVRFLAKQRPEALGVADARGSIPLHIAVARDASSMKLVRFLVERSPGSVRTRNATNGMLPLFIAATADAPLDVVFFLATTWPEAVNEILPPS